MNDTGGFFLLLIAATALTWFFTEPRIYPKSVRYAEQVCSTNGGRKFIEEGRTMTAAVTCENGAVFTYEWDKLERSKP